MSQPSDELADVRWTALEVTADRSASGLAELRRAVREEIALRGGTVVDDPTADARPDVVIGWAAGDAAVDVVAGAPDVAALVLVGCGLSANSIELISECGRTAIFTLSDPAQRGVLAAAVDGHLASPHAASDIEITPLDPTLAPKVAAWLDGRVSSGARVEEVTITTPDGWRLGADLVLPANADGGVPAVVLMHSGRSDRTVFDGLADVLARRGLAVLALDWRGRGVSTNLGHFVDFTSEQQDAVAGDVTASYDYLADRPEIDGSRLGVLGVAHGAGYGASGALGDPRTKALAMMTAYHLLDEPQREALAGGDVAVLCVACTPNRKSTGALREIHRTSTHSGSRMMEFPEGLLGYQLFDVHPDLEPAIADWFAEVLQP